MPSTKYEGLKSRCSVIRSNFLEYRTKQATVFPRINKVYALFATNKEKHIHSRHVSCSCGDTIYSEKYKEKSKKINPIFESLPFLY